MSSPESISAIIAAADVLIPLTLLTVWLALRRALPHGAHLRIFGLALVAVLVWAGLWSWVPALAAMRLLPPPLGLPGVIFSVLLGFLALMFLQPVRDFFRNADLVWLVTMGGWRPVYGGALLAIGLLGGLPPAFFWSAAIGDILVGIWALWMMARKLNVSRREVAAWNIFGLADLAHVLVLGAINLRPFYLANPDVSPLNLLPMAGVPVFLALHIMTLWGLAEQRRHQGKPEVTSPLPV
ncbi:MAG: hypothetical protein ACRC56_08070 [Bosea sp. (in: a-proteobacteria)]